MVHNETSTGATSRIDEVRKAIDAAKHPALLMVDTISSLASIDYRHDEWGVDVTVGGSQKGLMLPPGLGFNAVSDKALAASKTAKLPKSYFAWDEMVGPNKDGFFPYTPATNLLYGLAEAIDMLHEEGPRPRVRAPRPACRGRAPRGEGLGPRDPVQGPEVLFVGADGRGHAGGAQRRRPAQDGARALRRVAGHRASPRWPARCSASATWATPTTSPSSPRWPASRWRCARQRAAQAGRRARGDGLFHRDGESGPARERRHLSKSMQRR